MAQPIREDQAFVIIDQDRLTGPTLTDAQVADIGKRFAEYIDQIILDEFCKELNLTRKTGK